MSYFLVLLDVCSWFMFRVLVLVDVFSFIFSYINRRFSFFLFCVLILLDVFSLCFMFR
jgi:hypothetical protein